MAARQQVGSVLLFGHVKLMKPPPNDKNRYFKFHFFRFPSRFFLIESNRVLTDDITPADWVTQRRLNLLTFCVVILKVSCFYEKCTSEDGFFLLSRFCFTHDNGVVCAEFFFFSSSFATPKGNSFCYKSTTCYQRLWTLHPTRQSISSLVAK